MQSDQTLRTDTDLILEPLIGALRDWVASEAQKGRRLVDFNQLRYEFGVVELRLFTVEAES